MMLTHVLEENNFKVLTAFNGSSALEILETETPDLVLLDIVLPGIDGLEVLKTIRSFENLKNIPVIIVSVIHEHGYIQRALDLKISAYVTKPYRLNHLREVIEDVMSEDGNPVKIYKSMYFV